MRNTILTAVALVGLASTVFNVIQVTDLRYYLDETVGQCQGYDSCGEAITYIEADMADLKAGMWQPANNLREMQANRDAYLRTRGLLVK